MRPEISVVMSVYNGERYLKEALDSILEQTFSDFEFIIIDDGSTDRSREILTEYAAREARIRLIENAQNIGLTKSLNKGLLQAQGRYIARQDADDISLPQRFEMQLAYLTAHQKIGLLGTSCTTIDKYGKAGKIREKPVTDTEIRWTILFDNPFWHTSVMFRRKLIKEHQLMYTEHIKFAQDYELWARMLHHTRAANLATPLVNVRFHSEQISTQKLDEQEATVLQVAKRELNRLHSPHQFTLRETKAIREWYWHEKIPYYLDDNLITLYKLSLIMLNAFEKQIIVRPETMLEIRKQWGAHILSFCSIAQLSHIWKPGIMRKMLFRDVIILMKVFLKAICKKMI